MNQFTLLVQLRIFGKHFIDKLINKVLLILIPCWERKLLAKKKYFPIPEEPGSP